MALEPSEEIHETRIERRLDTALARAVTPRGAAIVIASMTTAITVIAAILVTILDHDTYPTLGSGLWWAAQTVTTVGYGDNVPQTVGGRLVAVFVMLLGISFLTVITAAITSTFVARSRVEQLAAAADKPSEEQLGEIARRLERIEAALSIPRSPS